jgi:hypothetical protein
VIKSLPASKVGLHPLEKHLNQVFREQSQIAGLGPSRCIAKIANPNRSPHASKQ